MKLRAYAPPFTHTTDVVRVAASWSTSVYVVSRSSTEATMKRPTAVTEDSPPSTADRASASVGATATSMMVPASLLTQITPGSVLPTTFVVGRYNSEYCVPPMDTPASL